MSVNGTVKIVERMCCSQCEEEIYECYNCDEYFSPGDFVSCGEDYHHVCEECYNSFLPKALNAEKD